MYKASDLSKGKMNEVFKEAYADSLVITHKSFGDYELVHSGMIDGLSFAVCHMINGHLVLDSVEGGFSWVEPMEYLGSDQHIAALAINYQHDLIPLSDDTESAVMSRLGIVYDTRIQAIDSMIANIEGV
tara:strand:+ start:247 stop:633 length:387 start_codon:yes stop_codon:yes gene_type:complete